MLQFCFCEQRKIRLGGHMAVVFGLVAMAMTLIGPCALANPQPQGPTTHFEFVKNDSPRDTMETFYKAMVDYHQGIRTDNPLKISRIKDATRCFAEKDAAMLTSDREKEIAAIFLKEVIDRVIAIDFLKIPNSTELNRWRLKNTEIVLRPQSSGERQGEWLITEGTWKRAKQFYQRVSMVNYLPNSDGGAMYNQPWMERYLPEWTKNETFSLKNWQWLGLLLGFFLGFLLKMIIQIGIRLAAKINRKAGPFKESNVIETLENPVGLFAAATFWWFWLQNLSIEGQIYHISNGFIMVAYGVSLIWAGYQLIGFVAQHFKALTAKTESTLDDQLVPFGEKFLKLTLVLLGSLLILQNLGFNVFSLLAGLGLGGLAFALAAQDTAANLFGSVMILVDRPFKIGDWVVVDNVEGVVEEIGFRSTRVRTFYNSLVTLPNAHVAKMQIDNMGERRLRRIKTQLDLTYDTNTESLNQFVEGVRKILKSTSGVFPESQYVYFHEYGPSSLKILLYFFTNANSFEGELETRQKVFYEIYDLAESMNVEFAFPTQTLHLNADMPLPTSEIPQN